MAILTKKL